MMWVMSLHKYLAAVLAIAGLTYSVVAVGQTDPNELGGTQPAFTLEAGDAQRGRLVFGQCRTCHYPEKIMGHNNGPNLHRIFGRIAGKQAGFEHYSDTFKQADFVWTPELLNLWLANPMAMFPDTTMMSLGVPDPKDRADLIAYLMKASVREP